MKKLYIKYPEGTLIALAVLFSAFMLGYFIWGVAVAANGIENVFTANKNAPENMGFDFADAAKLNLRGLAQ